MPWRPPARARERIMVYGSIGTGKTKGAMDIAKKLGPDDTMYVIDIDNSWERGLEAYPELGLREEWYGSKRESEYEVEGGQIVLYHCRGWEESTDAIATVNDRAGRNDWLVVDDASWLWADVLEWYIKISYGDDLPDFLLKHRLEQIKDTKAKDTDGKDAVLVEWNYINPRWTKLVARPFANVYCNLYVMASGKAIRTDGRERNDTKVMYGTVGVKPDSQWRLGGQMQTVLLASKTMTGEYKLTTVKDRGDREELEDEPWTDLFSAYLRKVAKWKVAR